MVSLSNHEGRWLVARADATKSYRVVAVDALAAAR
jgi:hypothetical protein